MCCEDLLWIVKLTLPLVWLFLGCCCKSGSLAIISNRVGLDLGLLLFSGGGDIGFNKPAVSAELNLVKLEGKEDGSWCGE